MTTGSIPRGGGARLEYVEQERSRARPPRWTDVRLYARLLREGRAFWGHVVLLLVLSLAAMPLALLTPLPLKIAIDSALGSHPLPSFIRPIAFGAASHNAALLLAAVLLIAFAALSQLQQLAASFLSTYTGERLMLQFRSKLFRHVQQLSLSHHDTHGTADASYRIQYDAESIQDVVVNGVTPLLTALVIVVGMLVVTARIDWQLAVIALTITPVLVLIARRFRPPLRGGWRDAKRMETSAIAVVQEVLTGLRVVKAFGQEDREAERFVHQATMGMRARVRLALLGGTSAMLFGLASSAGTAAVLYVGIRHVRSGALTLGDLLVVMAYLTQLFAPLTMIGKSLMTLQSALASAERAYKVLDQEPDVPDKPDARRVERARGVVEFRNVSFAYRGRDRVLEDVSFSIGAGTRLGISGATGAGKTTLVSLLTRFYDPTSGAILLDGVDLRDYRLADLRAQFGIVLQEPVLFSTTIGENIAYARPDAHVWEIVKAAKAANAHDFIVRLPGAYDAIVGERGMKLSGGERQRISLARAFLKDAPILVLDEPTSSVDFRTEATIMEAMARLMKGRTTFMIAHRLETLKGCDVRLELDQGRVVRRDDAEPEGVAAPLAPPRA